MDRWTFGAASVRGPSHVKSGTRLQDAKRCFELPDIGVFCAVVSDGAGSASHGGEGASIVCRTMGESMRRHFADNSHLPDEPCLWDWLDNVRDRIGVASSKRGLTLRDFAATMVLAITDSRETITAHVGDGAAVGRVAQDQQWIVLSRPENGEYANTTYFVTDNPTARMRVSHSQETLDCLCLFTDGIEHQVMDAISGEPYAQFFNPLRRPFATVGKPGRNAHLSGRLAAYLDGPQLAEHTDDDKTIIVAAVG